MSLSMRWGDAAIAAKYARDARRYALAAEESAQRAEAASPHLPILGENGNWWFWDPAREAYVDTGSAPGGTGNNTGGSNGGNTGDNTGGNTGDNTGGDTGGNTGDNTGGSTGGSSGDNTGGSTGSGTGGSTGDNTGGNTGGSTGGGAVTVDDALSESSENPVQNRVLTGALRSLIAEGASQPTSAENRLWIDTAPGAGLRLITAEDYAPEAKSAEMTQSVGVDANGKLWTAPGGAAASAPACEAAALATEENEGKLLVIQNGSLAAAALEELVETWLGGEF